MFLFMSFSRSSWFPLGILIHCICLVSLKRKDGRGSNPPFGFKPCVLICYNLSPLRSVYGVPQMLI